MTSHGQKYRPGELKMEERECSQDFPHFNPISIFAQNVHISGRIFFFTILACEIFKVKMKNCKYYQQNIYLGSKYF